MFNIYQGFNEYILKRIVYQKWFSLVCVIKA